MTIPTSVGAGPIEDQAFGTLSQFRYLILAKTFIHGNFRSSAFAVSISLMTSVVSKEDLEVNFKSKIALSSQTE